MLTTGEEWTVERTLDEVVVRSDVRLPFQPKGSMLALRGAIRAAVGALVADSAESAMTATYASARRDFVDIENVLFYNVGTSVFGQPTRLVFARVLPVVGDMPHEHRYRSGGSDHVTRSSHVEHPRNAGSV